MAVRATGMYIYIYRTHEQGITHSHTYRTHEQGITHSHTCGYIRGSKDIAENNNTAESKQGSKTD